MAPFDQRRRVTYFAEAGPRSQKTHGLVKVGQSRNPEGRARDLGTRLIGTTSLTEGEIRAMLRPFTVARARARNLEQAREWYVDCLAVRWFALWACEVHPADPPREAHEEPYTRTSARIRAFPERAPA